MPTSLPEARQTSGKCAVYPGHDPHVMQHAWSRTGLVPWNPQVVLDNPTDVNTLPPPTRDAVNINVKVITGSRMIAEMKGAERERDEKKRERDANKREREEKRREREEKRREREEKKLEREENKRKMEENMPKNKF